MILRKQTPKDIALILSGKTIYVCPCCSKTTSAKPVCIKKLIKTHPVRRCIPPDISPFDILQSYQEVYEAGKCYCSHCKKPSVVLMYRYLLSPQKTESLNCPKIKFTKWCDFLTANKIVISSALQHKSHL